MAATRTFNHLTFDSQNNVELHFSRFVDAQSFVLKLKTDSTFLELSSANDFSIRHDSTCQYCLYNFCSVVTLRPILFDLVVGRVKDEKGGYYQLQILFALMKTLESRKLEETLVNMSPPLQVYALRLILNGPSVGILPLLIDSIRTAEDLKSFIEMFRILPADICDEIALIGGKGKSTKGIGFITATAKFTPELFSNFNAKLTREVRNRAALLSHSDTITIGLAVAFLSDALLTEYLNQLDPTVLLQAAIKSKKCISRSGYSYHYSIINKNVNSIIANSFKEIKNPENQCLIEFSNLMGLKRQLEELSFVAANILWSKSSATFYGETREISAPLSKEILAIINAALDGEYYFQEATTLIKTKLKIGLPAVTNRNGLNPSAA